jgi:hypothetical protein
MFVGLGHHGSGSSPRPARKQDLYIRGFLIVIVVALMALARESVNPKVTVQAQSTTSRPGAMVLRFDVVSIRENREGAAGGEERMSLRDGFLQVNNLLLKSLITSAYGVPEGLIFGLPGWAEEAHYDIRARVTDADPIALTTISREQRRALMGAMLEDRFQLKSTRSRGNYPCMISSSRKAGRGLARALMNNMWKCINRSSVEQPFQSWAWLLSWKSLWDAVWSMRRG